ncbi:hypothetical protein EDD85DRAFT_794517 [Armillaria nabsnona]|nr:hypothetical protein EDD85DRAFT_794517 [Armillaria nabsnona]
MSTPSHSQEGAENPQPVPVPADVVANQGNERIPYSDSQTQYLVDARPQFKRAVLAGTVQQFLTDFYKEWFARYPEDPEGNMFDGEQDNARVYQAKILLLGERWTTMQLAGDIGSTANILIMMDHLTQMTEQDWLSNIKLGFSEPALCIFVTGSLFLCSAHLVKIECNIRSKLEEA